MAPISKTTASEVVSVRLSSYNVIPQWKGWRVLSAALSTAGDIEVVSTAFSGAECLARVQELRPDVVTLDVEMPGMDGLAVLRQLMAQSPLPVVMASYLTHQGATATMRSLLDGAVDFVPQPGGAILTGMGVDGADGAEAIHRAGGTVIAEDQSTCAVYGMPRAVAARGIADHVVTLPEVAGTIRQLLARPAPLGQRVTVSARSTVRSPFRSRGDLTPQPAARRGEGIGG